MKEAKVEKVEEGLYKIETPFWCWDSHPYILKALRQLVIGGELPFYVCKRSGFRDTYLAATTQLKR